MRPRGEPGDPNLHAANYDPACLFDLAITMDNSLTDTRALGVLLNLHSGWSFHSVAGTNAPTIVPTVGATGWKYLDLYATTFPPQRDFKNAQAILAWARTHELTVRQHELLNPLNIPAYLFDSNAPNFQPHQILLDDHIDGVLSNLYDTITGYSDVITQAVVVNEALRDEGVPYKRDIEVSESQWLSLQELRGLVPSMVQFMKAIGPVEDPYPCNFGWEDLKDTKIRNCYYDRTGDAIITGRYVEDSFAKAREILAVLSPNTKLIYNDYNIDSTYYRPDFAHPSSRNGKADRAYHLMQYLLDSSRDVQVGSNTYKLLDGIGLQMYIWAWTLWDATLDACPVQSECVTAAYLQPFVEGVREQICRMRNLGLTVEITEMDVLIWHPANDATIGPQLPPSVAWRSLPLKRQRAIQALIYQEVITACVQAGANITFWSAVDKYSWFQGPRMFNQPGVPFDSTLMDEAYRRKVPAYSAVLQALQMADNPVPCCGTLAYPPCNFEAESSDCGLCSYPVAYEAESECLL
jgi:GH35 family endo-1,4-beta-xylanase